MSAAGVNDENGWLSAGRLPGWQPRKRTSNADAIASVLTQAGAQIVEGPRAGGFYRIRLGGPDLAATEAQRRLDALRQASAVVRFVAPSP